MCNAAGTRNIVGMQFHPTNKTLYFSCNGRDQIGDNTPDDYIAYAPTSGLNFGYPYCHRYGSLKCHRYKFLTVTDTARRHRYSTPHRHRYGTSHRQVRNFPLTGTELLTDRYRLPHCHRYGFPHCLEFGFLHCDRYATYF